MNVLIRLPVLAITTRISATVPLVVQSFSPLITYSDPSSDRVAAVLMLAGSDPASFSVSANAEMAPLASRGKYFFFLSIGPEQLERLRKTD